MGGVKIHHVFPRFSVLREKKSNTEDQEKNQYCRPGETKLEKMIYLTLPQPGEIRKTARARLQRERESGGICTDGRKLRRSWEKTLPRPGEISPSLLHCHFLPFRFFCRAPLFFSRF